MLGIGACMVSTKTKSADFHRWSRVIPKRRKKAQKQNQNI
jgi:hypothetical protein